MILEIMNAKGELVDIHGIGNVYILQFLFTHRHQGRNKVKIIGLQNSLFIMDTSSISTMSLSPIQSAATELRDIKKKIKRHNHFLHQLNIEGGRHVEIVYRDIVQL